jgi:cytochrome P450
MHRRLCSSLPPGPPAPAIVQALRFARDPFGFLTDCSAQYGDLFTLRLPGQPPIIVTSAPELVRQCFALRPTQPRRPLPLSANVGEQSLIFLDGAPHLRDRQLMMPHLHGERLRSHAATMQAITAAAVSTWRPGQVVPVHAAMQAIALDIILRCVFAVTDPGRGDALRRPLLAWLDGTFTSSVFVAGILFTAARMRRFLDGAAERSLRHNLGRRPGRRLLPWRLLPWHRWADAKASVLTLLRADIAQCRDGGAHDRDDVLAMLATARYPDGTMMSEDQLIDELVTLLVGGHETTANTVSFALYRLLQRPDVVAKIRAELARVFGDGPIDPRRTGELRYLDACIKESMRLTPILPAISRPVPATLELRGHVIPAGCDLWLAPSLTHMRPDLWDRPERFMPERFLGNPPPTAQYFPFGGGHRTCIGVAFATVEMRIIIAEVLRRVDVHLSPGTSVRVGVRGSTVAPLGTLELVVERVRPPAIARAC